MFTIFSKIYSSMNSSLRNKLIITFISVITLPLCLLVYISYTYYADNLSESTITNSVKLMGQLNRRVEDYFGQIEKISMSFYTDLLFSSQYQFEDNGYQLKNMVMKKLQDIYMQKKETNSVILYLPSSKEAYVVNRAINKSFENNEILESYKWYKDVITRKGNSFAVEPAHLLEGYPDDYQIDGAETVFSESRIINYYSKIYGVLCINYSTKHLIEMFNEVIVNKYEVIYLVDGNGEIICSSHGDSKGKFDENILKSIKTIPGQNGTLKYKDTVSNSEMLLIYTRSFNNDNILLQVIPMKVVLMEAIQTRNINIAISIIIILILFFTTTAISMWITKPLQSLKRTMEKVGSGNLNIRVNAKNTDEIGKISVSFNNMIDQINSLIDEKYKMRLKFNEAQLKVLHAQMNPHFLYNTLQAFGSVACEEGIQELDFMAKALSDMLRYSIKSGGDIVTIRDEIKNVKDYLYIQKFRYEEKLEFIIDIPENIYDIKVPKLLFQPIVENAIVHGIEPSLVPGIVNIACTIKDSNLCVDITDNGVGMTQEMLDEIKNDFKNFDEDTFDEGNKIGILNVYHRLAIMFGKEFSMNVKSEINRGTKIEMVIPVELFENSNWGE